MKHLILKEIDNILSCDVSTLSGTYINKLDNSIYTIQNNAAMFVGLSSGLNIEDYEDNSNDNGFVSESFVLKMLAIKEGKVKDIEL